MYKYAKFFILFFCLFGFNSINAQVANGSGNAAAADTNIKTSNLNTDPSTINTTSAETIPSPESQGFIKYTDEKGTVTYKKKVDDVIIEYKPKQ